MLMKVVLNAICDSYFALFDISAVIKAQLKCCLNSLSKCMN